MNNCLLKSTAAKCEALGSPLVSGTWLVRQLKEKDRTIDYRRQMMKDPKNKAKRSARIKVIRWVCGTLTVNFCVSYLSI